MKPKLIQPPAYSSWLHMFGRCYDPRVNAFKNYGARGIRVCRRWRDYSNFIADMGPPPPETSLDRIDNDKDYTPQNCRWATRKQQQRNQRRTIKVNIDGAEYLAIELAELSGKKVDDIVARVKRGLPYELVISKTKLHYRVKKTHCKYGHEYTPQNTNITPEGWQDCRTCSRLKTQRQRAERQALKTS